MSSRRRSKNDRREPLGVQAAARPRATRGRTGTAETPLTIRTNGVTVSDELRAYVHGRAGFQLGRFARNIERIQVRFHRVRGVGGKPAVRCRITVLVTRLQNVIAEATAPTARAAFGDAVAASARWVKHLQERRTRLKRKPGTAES